ncbi:Acid phosphatase [Bertholletia excelsa]
MAVLVLGMGWEVACARAKTRWSNMGENGSYCLSWRLAVEANNVGAWRTVPTQCLRQVGAYMTGGQYDRDVSFVMDRINSYIDTINISRDGFDAWILDVDDTCISNLRYYRGKRFGCDPYDPEGFKTWAQRGECPAIPAVLKLFNKLVDSGFKVFLVTGRDEATLGQVTLDNLHNQGFDGYERLILRTAAYRGVSAVVYKSEIRKELEGEGYRIRGNAGDQWSDLQGDCLGNRTFKLPNPMYFVP